MIIRNATKNDSAEIIACLVYDAGPEMYDFLYKTNHSTAVDFLKYEFASGRGLSGYNNIIIGCIDDKPAVTASIYNRNKYYLIALGTIINILFFYGLSNSLSVIYKIIKILEITKCPKNKEIFLANFSVMKELRGKGLGSYFLKNQIEKHKNNRYEVFGLDVLMSNVKAEKFYLNHGLKVVEERIFSRVSLENRIPGTKKMELHLA